MFPQVLSFRFSVKKTVFILLCCAVPASNATASVLQLALPAVLAKKNTGPSPDPYWRTAQVLAENLDSSTSIPQLATDSTGNALVAWSQLGGFYSRRYQVGVGWREAEYAGLGGGGLQIAMKVAGKAVAVWTKYDGETDKAYAYAQLYTTGTGWSEATVIGSSGTPSMNPIVAMDSSGNIQSVWIDGMKPARLWTSIYDGTSWTISEIPSGYGVGVANPILGMDGTGNAILVWLHRGSNFYNATANRYELGVWGTSQCIEETNLSTDITNSSSPHLSVNSAGNAVAVWYQSNQNAGTWVNWYEVGTGWGTAQLWTSGSEIDDIVLDPAGNAIAVWQQSDGTHTNIWASRYAVGTGWGTAQSIETNDSGDATSPKVAVDEDGNAIAVWQQSDGIHTKIWANRYVVGSGWGAAQSIETENSDDATLPQIAISATGKATATWRQFDGTQYSIWANRFE